MKKLQLNDIHSKTAKMGEFAGWNMPIWYSSINDEHLAVRNSAGIFDISHMGEFYFEGKDALKFLEHVAISNVSKLQKGDSVYTCILNQHGAIKDEAVIYNFGDRYGMVCDAVAYEKLDEWFNKVAKDMGGDIKIRNMTRDMVLLAIQGPKAYDLFKDLYGKDLTGSKRFTAIDWDHNGKHVTISISGYTREKGFELLFEEDSSNPELSKEFWTKFTEAGAVPCGLGCRNTLRIECGFTLYPHETYELNLPNAEIDEITPLETRFSWMVDWDKEFIGKGALTKLKEQGIRKNMFCLEMAEPGIPRGDYLVFQNGKEIGKVTSGTLSPLTKKGIAIALLAPDTEGEVEIQIRNQLKKAKVVPAPFYDREKYGASRTETGKEETKKEEK